MSFITWCLVASIRLCWILVGIGVCDPNLTEFHSEIDSPLDIFSSSVVLLTYFGFLASRTLRLVLFEATKFVISCSSINKKNQGLPWWRNGWESACQCRGHGFVPRSGRIPHAAERLGPWATTAEPARLELVLRNKRGRDSERPAHRDEEWPPLAATRESPCTEAKIQHSQKNK